MQLLEKLRRLAKADRGEDFHTEIVAQVLRNDPELTRGWLFAIGATLLQEIDWVRVDTQEFRGPLVEFEQTSGSRVDIVIRLVGEGRTELVFVESKLPSKQRVGQLQKYAEHLRVESRRHPLRRTSLVFITRAFEAATEPELDGFDHQLTFCSTRWFVFYRYLRKHPRQDGLTAELISFMESNLMSTGNQFRATDALALEHFFSAQALMEETLSGVVSERFEAVCAKVSSENKAFQEFRKWARYVRFIEYPSLTVLLGYWMPKVHETDPVWVGLMLQSNPQALSRKALIKQFKALLTGGDEWSADSLDDEKEWSSVASGRPLYAFMAGDDHVEEIRKHFLKLLDSLEQFRKANPSFFGEGDTEENASSH